MNLYEKPISKNLLDRNLSDFYEGRYQAMTMDYQDKVRREGNQRTANYHICEQVLPIMGEILEALKEDRVKDQGLFEQEMLLGFSRAMIATENEELLELGINFAHQNFQFLLETHRDFFKNYPEMERFLEKEEEKVLV